MKRTEMLNEIHNLLRSEDLIGTGYYDVADMVLKLIEEQGMMPPTTIKIHPVSLLPVDMNTWDPDEEA